MQCFKTGSGWLFAAGLLLNPAARAQNTSEYPARPIRLIAPAPPGGAYDFIARAVAEGLQKAWGQAVIVDNRAGASGVIGVEAAAKAVPDGYTLVIGSTGPFAVSQRLVKNLRYDAVKDFAPIGRIAIMPSYLVVNTNVPATDARQFLGYARANPGKLSYASTGNGFSQFTNVELMKSMAGLDIVAVSYRGSGPALTDLLGRQVDMMIELGPQAIPYIRSGQLRVLATTTRKRTEALPDVPTLDESGIPGFEAFTWFGLYAPAGTPKEIVAKLSTQLFRIFSAESVKGRMANIGAEASVTDPASLAEFQAAETRKWTAVIDRTGIKPE